MIITPQEYTQEFEQEIVARQIEISCTDEISISLVRYKDRFSGEWKNSELRVKLAGDEIFFPFVLAHGVHAIELSPDFVGTGISIEGGNLDKITNLALVEKDSERQSLIILGESDWKAAIAAEASVRQAADAALQQQIVSNAGGNDENQYRFFENFPDLTQWDAVAANGGSFTPLTDQQSDTILGVQPLGITNTASSSVLLRRKGDTLTTNQYHGFRGNQKNVMLRCRAKLDYPLTSAFSGFGLTRDTSQPFLLIVSPVIFFSLHNGGYPAAFVWKDSVYHTTDNTTKQIIDTDWHEYKIIVDYAGDLHAFIDNEEIGTPIANSILPTSCLKQFVGYYKGGTISPSPQWVYIDFFEHTVNL